MNILRRSCLVLAAALGALALAPAALAAGEPTMGLEQLRQGMRCTGLSVVQGTEPSGFDVEILDVIAGDPSARAPRILFRVSGPAVDRTGIGPGFSGSPIYCADAAGTLRNVGAISESIGEFGGKTGLATPIARILSEPVAPPMARGSAAPAATPAVRGARRLAGPITFGGLSGPVATAVSTAGRAAGRVVYAVPGALRQAGAPAAPFVLRPGSAMGVGLATGDVTASSIGTVAYMDGTSVWSFGHPLEAVGRRGLLLQAARVHTVVNNPVASQELITYKLASPIGDLGTLTNDAPDAVVGRLGALPQSFPLRVIARDLDTGRTETTTTRIADESAVGQPSGSSAISQVAPVAVAQAAYDTLRGSPTRQGGRMCVRMVVRESRAPLRFCNTYAGGGGPQSAGAPMVGDLQQAIALLDSYRLGRVRLTEVEVYLELRRGLRQAYLRTVRGPSVVRRGRSYAVRVSATRVGGGTVRRTARVRIPTELGRGERTLTLTGVPADPGGEEAELGEVLELSFGDDEEIADDPGPPSIAALIAQVAGLERFDGVTATFGGGVAPQPLFTDAEDDGLRYSGRVRFDVRVR